MTVSFENWLGERELPFWGTNSGAPTIAFQEWHHFKEAFAPELIANACRSVPGPVRRCIDPFGGSGTTALACQFLNLEPTSIEINPYLADLIEAKLCEYDIESLAKDAGAVAAEASKLPVDPHELLKNAPNTLVEPGYKDRWVFGHAIAERILALRESINRTSNGINRRLMRVILGGQLIGLSNVTVNGKGRRYRSGWRSRNLPPQSVLNTFVDALSAAVHDITRHRNRPTFNYDLRRGDARRLIPLIEPADVAVFSPPYPNSFDYTDVYNVELWMLGYLKTKEDNTTLRHGTLSSHVQIKRKYADAPSESPTLSSVLTELNSKSDELWDRHIPAMIGAYFADLATVLNELRNKIRKGGQVHMVVGDSRYSGVTVPVARIVSELAPGCGFAVRETDAFRSMRSSAQQGGRPILPETLIVLA